MEVPYLWFFILWVIDLFPVVPVFWLLGFRVLDFLGWEEIPVVLQVTRLHFGVVDADLVGVVGTDYQCV